MPSSQSQSYCKQIALFTLFLLFLVGRSNGFLVSPPTSRRRKSHPFTSDTLGSASPSSFAPTLVQHGADSIRGKQSHSQALSKRHAATDGMDTRRDIPAAADDVRVSAPRASPLFGRPEVRLYATPNGSDDDQSPSSSRLRSLLSKIFDILARPVRLVVAKPLKWIRKRFGKKDKVVEKYIEESIEEQANAVQKAIAEIEAKASEYQQKSAAVDTEHDLLDKSEPMPPTDGATVTEVNGDAAIDAKEAESLSDEPSRDEAAVQVQTDADTATDTNDTANAAFDKTDTIAQKQIATAEPQMDVVARVEEKQTKDAALASEEDMRDKVSDDTQAETQSTLVVTNGQSASKEEIPSMINGDTLALDKTELIAQEQQATAEAQSEIVEKVEAFQANDAVLATEQGMLAQLDKAEAMDADVMSEMKQPAQKQTPSSVSATVKPVGDRWAVAAPGVDLSGEWSLIISDDFKKEYDTYLKQLGQPFLVRSVALTLIGVTKEETEQKEDGRTLFIRGTNARGIWERTLVTSGADIVNDQFTPLHVPIDTADDERVEAEAWWENEGSVHRSWMRGLNKYGGGNFESKRYLDEGGKVLVCESIFHPNENGRKDVSVTWRFLRNGESLDAW